MLKIHLGSDPQNLKKCYEISYEFVRMLLSAILWKFVKFLDIFLKTCLFS